MKIPALLTAITIFASATSYAVPPSEILIPGTKLFTESITSLADGSLIIGAMGPGAIFRATPGSERAEVWIQPSTGGLASVLGVFADEKASTLWVCSFTNTPNAAVIPPSALHAFDLTTGAPKGRWALPGAKSICNDIAVGPDGTAYVTDSENMEIVSLKPGGKALEVWAGNGAFGAKGEVIDGIAVVRGRVVVNVLETGKLFSVPILPNGKAGSVVEVKLDRPLTKPDGHRSVGKDAILLVDAGEGGRLVRIALGGQRLETGKVTTLQAGFADGPTGVTVVGNTAYVMEAQFETAEKLPARPYAAKAVSLGK